MENTLAYYIIPLLLSAVLLIGLVLLVKQKQIGWLVPIVDYFGSSFFGFFRLVSSTKVGFINSP